MARHSLPYAVNLSMLFTELPVLERVGAARAAGFDAAEFWWPFPEAVPSDADVDAFVRAFTDTGTRLVAVNFFAGDTARGDRGVVSLQDGSTAFRDNVDVAVGMGERLGCRIFNALYGNRVEGHEAAFQDEVAVANLAVAGAAAARAGGTVVVEPLSGAPHYPLSTAADAVAVIDRVRAETGVGNLGLLADLYHLSVNGDDLDGVIDAHADRIAHVQIADAPGRSHPGSGTLDLDGYLARLEARGYAGHVGLEYRPRGSTTDSLRWLDRRHRCS